MAKEEEKTLESEPEEHGQEKKKSKKKVSERVMAARSALDRQRRQRAEKLHGRGEEKYEEGKEEFIEQVRTTPKDWKPGDPASVPPVKKKTVRKIKSGERKMKRVGKIRKRVDGPRPSIAEDL